MVMEYFEAAGLPVPDIRHIRLVCYSSLWTMTDYFAWQIHGYEIRENYSVGRITLGGTSITYVDFKTDADAVTFKLMWSDKLRIEPFPL